MRDLLLTLFGIFHEDCHLSLLTLSCLRLGFSQMHHAKTGMSNPNLTFKGHSYGHKSNSCKPTLSLLPLVSHPTVYSMLYGLHHLLSFHGVILQITVKKSAHLSLLRLFESSFCSHIFNLFLMAFACVSTHFSS